MRVLVIGGNRFLGVELAYRLLAAGHHVTVVHRGNLPDVVGPRDRAERLLADRSTDAFDVALAGRRFDAVVDFAAFAGADVERAARVLGGRVGHYVMISSGQVYLVREACPRPAREDDYDGPLIAEPRDAADRDEFRYGVGKRDAEDTLARAGREGAFGETRLRIPMVSGERDYYGRIEAYVARLLEGGPIVLPDGGAELARHVYGSAVVRAIVGGLGDARWLGRAWNLAQDEVPTVAELVAAIARELGAAPELVGVSRAAIVDAGLDPRRLSPFSSRWMSLVDPARAKREIAFEHPPLATYLGSIVRHLLARDAGAPAIDRATRAAELELARRAGRPLA